MAGGGGIEQIPKLLKGRVTFRADCRLARHSTVLRHWGTAPLGDRGERSTETLSGFCWGLGYALITSPAAVKVSFVCTLWQWILSVKKKIKKKFIDCLSI